MLQSLSRTLSDQKPAPINYKNLKLVADNEHMTEKRMKWLFIEECMKIAVLSVSPPGTADSIARTEFLLIKRV